jgi:peptidoglycan/LPS O-acetylase OafA/YrhL
MTALLVLFMMKRRDSVLLHLFGVYSYEIYLLHWPLISRYDPLYALLPAWLATLAWLAVFIACSWVVRRMVTPIEALVDRNPAPNPGR